MAQVKIYGKVVELSEPRTGETNGQAWSMQDLFIEEPSDRDIACVAVVVNNYRLSNDEAALIKQSVEQGTLITLSCDIKGRKWERNGKVGYSNNIKVWRVEQGDTRQAQPKPQERNTEPNVIRIGGAAPTPPAAVQPSATGTELPF
jgi:hypothetical protein